MDQITIIQADLGVPEHRCALTELIQLYANDPMGLGDALPADHGSQLISGLRDFPTTVLFLAFSDQQAVGLAVCFFGFSTFVAKPLLNIHDLIVHPDFRRRGVARDILTRVAQHAEQEGCCKVTLEVRCDNAAAQSLYRQCDFSPGETPYEFWTSAR